MSIILLIIAAPIILYRHLALLDGLRLIIAMCDSIVIFDVLESSYWLLSLHVFQTGFLYFVNVRNWLRSVLVCERWQLHCFTVVLSLVKDSARGRWRLEICDYAVVFQFIKVRASITMERQFSSWLRSKAACFPVMLDGKLLGKSFVQRHSLFSYYAFA